MTRSQVILFTLILICMGAGWGLTVPLSKIAVSTGHRHFGLIFWDTLIGAVVLTVVLRVLKRPLPLSAPALRVYVVIALLGTLIPNAASYQALHHLPAGLMAVLLSLVPMLAFPIALGLGLERFNLRRFAGLFAGLCGVLLLVLPEASLPDPAMLVWVPLALVASVCYACEGNYVSRWGTAGLGPMQVLLGASLVSAGLSLPLALSTGQFISPLRSYEAPELALIAAAFIHVVTYSGYVWLVSRAGSVFAVQVSYLVTAFGVLFSLALLGESYSPYFWFAMAVILSGVFLVQPRRQDVLAPGGSISETPR
ncbi:DMT family transporter [Rhodobacteraceae bacterium F11138]|nr:DMT family transporter [Rhodobacteraceae bacterium F11138]